MTPKTKNFLTRTTKIASLAVAMAGVVSAPFLWGSALSMRVAVMETKQTTQDRDLATVMRHDEMILDRLQTILQELAALKALQKR